MKNKWINKMVLVFLLLFSTVGACDACKLQQPKVTRGITHGTGPESNWDWFIVGVIIIITLLTLYYSLKYLIKPEEKDKNHIKYTVLSDFINYDKR